MSIENTMNGVGDYISDKSASLYEYLTPTDEAFVRKTDQDIADMYYESDTGEGKVMTDTQLTQESKSILGSHDRDEQIGFSGQDYAEMAGWAAKGILAIKALNRGGKRTHYAGGRYGTGTTASKSAMGIYSILGLK